MSLNMPFHKIPFILSFKTVGFNVLHWNAFSKCLTRAEREPYSLFELHF